MIDEASREERLPDRQRQERWQSKIPVDAHVHFHRRRFVIPTLDAAAANFSALALPSGRLTGMLLLAESENENVFEGLAATEAAGSWVFRPVTAEPQTVIASDGEREIAIVCGRQIRCAQGLEVLALGTTARFPEGRAPAETIAEVRREDAVAVFPWGFGKWIGGARRTASRLFGESSPAALFAGDNGGRLQWLGRPRQLRAASRSGFRVLPGTDPFPFGNDYRRVGGFGFLADFSPDRARPWHSLKHWLEAGKESPVPYGRAVDPLRFVFNQSWIQVRNRFMRRGVS